MLAAARRGARLLQLALHEPPEPMRALQQRRVNVLLHALHPERPGSRHPVRELADLVHPALAGLRVLDAHRELRGGAVVQALELPDDVLLQERGDVAWSGDLVCADEEFHP